MARGTAPECAVSARTARDLRKKTGGTHWGLAALLAALTMVSPFSIDTFYPSFPTIAAEFSLNNWQIQQTITVYMLPFAVMSLLQGPLSDALGRRPVVIGGLSIYSVASIACVVAPSYAVLLVFRAMQGMSAGVGLAVGRAIVRDLHEGPQAQRLMSAITMIFGVAPAIAPVIGGWIHVWFGWRSVFGFMAVLGVLLVTLSYLRLPETHPAERRVPLNAGMLGRTLWRVASRREFMLLALTAGINFAAMLTFIGAAPAIVLEHWHLTETQFAWLFVPLIIGISGGAWISGRLAGRIPADRQVALGFTLAIAGTSLSVMLHGVFDAPPIVAQQVLIAVIATGVQVVIPILALRMLDLFPDARGSAASVQSCVILATGAIGIGAVVPALNHSMLYLSAGSFACTLVAFAFWRLARRLHGLP